METLWTPVFDIAWLMAELKDVCALAKLRRLEILHRVADPTDGVPSLDKTHPIPKYIPNFGTNQVF